MTLFRYLAYLSPLLAGFGLPAALALTAGRPFRTRLLAVAAVHGALVLLLGLAAFTEGFGAFARTTVLLSAFSLLVAGLHLTCESFRLPGGAAQVVTGVAVVALMGTIFTLGPLVVAAANHGLANEAIHSRISLMLAVNPLMVMGYSIFETPVLHHPELYHRLDLTAYPFEPPRWGTSSAGFASAGAILLGLAAAVRRIARRPA